MTCILSLLRAPDVTPTEFPDFPSYEAALHAVQAGYISAPKKNDIILFERNGVRWAYGLRIVGDRWAIFDGPLRTPYYYEQSASDGLHRLKKYELGWNTFYSEHEWLASWLKVLFYIRAPIEARNLVMLSIMNQMKEAVTPHVLQVTQKMMAAALQWDRDKMEKYRNQCTTYSRIDDVCHALGNNFVSANLTDIGYDAYNNFMLNIDAMGRLRDWDRREMNLRLIAEIKKHVSLLDLMQWNFTYSDA